MTRAQARRLLEHLRARREEIVAFLCGLVLAESPTDVPEAQGEVQAMLAKALRSAGYRIRHIPGQSTGGHLLAYPADRHKGRPLQLLLGHSDTVWPTGTLAEMPLVADADVVRGPGAYDMKAGLAQTVFALRSLRDLGLDPPLTPVLLVNSDEEVGSPESHRWVRLLARRSARAFVMEPSYGPSGQLKTARKGGGQFTVTVEGRAAHAGLAPETGVSAILELSHVIQRLHALNDPARGVTVNVGVIDGGLRPNVVAPASRAVVDVRVLTAGDARAVETAIHGLTPTVPGTRLQVQGGVTRPAMERTPRNQALWRAARRAGQLLGLELEEVTAGGGSDGNTTSQFTATLDGLGAVGDGAHARHEFVRVDALVERSALLAALLLRPLDPEEGAGRTGEEAAAGAVGSRAAAPGPAEP